MKKDKDMHDKRTEPDVSAQFYLSKFQEFSENVLAHEELGHDVELEKTLHFISSILQADAVILAEIFSDYSNGSLKAVANGTHVSRALVEKQVSILLNVFEEDFTFDANDDGSREVARFLFDDIIPMSGFSVPIKNAGRLRGVLAVHYTSNIPLSDSKILFLKSMASVLSHVQQSRDLLSQVDIKHARLVFDAKREWEGTVDSLEQLIIVLDEDARVIRANKAIQYWEVDGLDAVIGASIETVITSLTGDDITNIFSSWTDIWKNLGKYQHLEWTSDIENEQILRFSLRKIIYNRERSSKQHQGYAVLFVEDITRSKAAEKQLQSYADHLEGALQKRNEELEQVNEMLRIELEAQNRTRHALAKSEEKYQTLFNSALSGICQLDEGYISFYNNRFSEIFKYPEDQLTGSRFIELFTEDEHEHIQALITEVDKDAEANRVKIAKAYDAHGKNLWLELSLGHSILPDNNNVIVNVIDITRLKNIEISLRESEERLQRLSGQLINAQETERKRLALELHDSLGQSLSAIKYLLEGMSRKIDCGGTNDCADEVADIISKIRNAIEETRNMSMELRPSMLDDLGIVSTINWFCRQYQATYKHIRIEKDIAIDESDIDESRKVAIYRIIQEAMNNTAKHSSADTIELSLRYLEPGYIQLMIADNGVGIKNLDNHPAGYTSMGLSGMRERVELTGGGFLLTHNAPTGVKIDIRWPSTSRRVSE